MANNRISGCGLLILLIVIVIGGGCIWESALLLNNPNKNGGSIFLAVVLLLCSIFLLCLPIYNAYSVNIRYWPIIKALNDHTAGIDDPEMRTVANLGFLKQELFPILRAYERSKEKIDSYNPEHYDNLCQGTEHWNTWRREQGIEHPELAGVEFFSTWIDGCDLSGAYLEGAKFREVNLENANLSHTRLIGTTFKDVNLKNANLSETYLADTIIEYTNFSGADFTKADIDHVTFTDATQFDGTDFSNAKMFAAGFIGIDLGKAKGLGTVEHRGPSTIDFDTIRRSEGVIPEHFLQGTGAPNPLIKAILSLQPHEYDEEYYSCFLSYSSTDELIVKRLHAELQAKGVQCWFAPHDLKPGDYVRKEIDQAIDMQDKVLLILSESAVNSGWVSHEVELALAREIRLQRKILYPIRLDNVVLQSTSHWANTLLTTRHIGDFTNWTDPQAYHQTFDRLLQDLKKADT